MQKGQSCIFIMLFLTLAIRENLKPTYTYLIGESKNLTANQDTFPDHRWPMLITWHFSYFEIKLIQEFEYCLGHFGQAAPPAFSCMKE